MNEKLSYSGVVTIIHRVNNKIVSEKHYNNGTINLFEAYARALCGQSIDRFIPKRLDVGIVNSGTFATKVKSGVTIPVLTTYKSGGTDGGEYQDGKYTEVNVPYCRVSTTLATDMFENIDEASELTVILKSASDLDIAEVNVDGLASAIKDASSGIQLLLVWDLYVTNTPTEPGENESVGNE